MRDCGPGCEAEVTKVNRQLNYAESPAQGDQIGEAERGLWREEGGHAANSAEVKGARQQGDVVKARRKKVNKERSRETAVPGENYT